MMHVHICMHGCVMYSCVCVCVHVYVCVSYVTIDADCFIFVGAWYIFHYPLKSYFNYIMVWDSHNVMLKATSICREFYDQID